MSAPRIIDIGLHVLLIVGEPVIIRLPVLDRFRKSSHSHILQRGIGLEPVPVMDQRAGKPVAEPHQRRLSAIGAAENDAAGAVVESLHEGLDHKGAH